MQRHATRLERAVEQATVAADLTGKDEGGGLQGLPSDAAALGQRRIVAADEDLRIVRQRPKLIGKLAAAGHLAVQMPDNLDEPAHRLMREVAAVGPWAGKLKGVERTERFDARRYYALLAPLCSRVDVWRTTYMHPLQGSTDAVVEWFNGSALRLFLAALSEDERPVVLTRYRDMIAQAYPALDDGTVLLPFPRLFIVATRK